MRNLYHKINGKIKFKCKREAYTGQYKLLIMVHIKSDDIQIYHIDGEEAFQMSLTNYEN